MVYDLTFEFLMKIGLSLLLGGIIGVEREITQHPAGLRTMILVCLGSTFIMFIPLVGPDPTIEGIRVTIDYTRVAAGVITGIGFLGAGVIFKEGANVHGLTTAASIWAVASIGLLVGVGLFAVSIIAAIVIFMVLHIFNHIEREYFKYDEFGSLLIKIKDKTKVKEWMENILKKNNINIALNNFKRDSEGITLIYSIQVPRSLKKDRITKILIQNTNLIELKWRK